MRPRSYEAPMQKMHRYNQKPAAAPGQPPVSISLTAAVPCGVPGLSVSAWLMMKQRLMSVFFYFFFSEGLIGQFPPG